ncbi:hypothetical protein COT72_00485 [archaeon CG10_big_fil_rev_8_21_14_0_10_43_11]|nr:MAG: hypothetical protein COT72_00485 [archaeon CG10_big_fil_rev_8_21_14_0_10_43_11]
MLELPFDKIVDKIVADSKLSKAEVIGLIEKKKDELQGLVSDEGAAFIVANEKGISFIPSKSEDFTQIQDIAGGLKSVNLVGRIITTYPIREFESKGRKGAVASFLIGDASGVVRVVIWNELTRLISEKKISIGDTIKILNAYSRINNDLVEVHLSNRSRLSLNPEGVSVPELGAFPQSNGSASNQGGGEVVLGTITYVFPQVRFFDVCGECNRGFKEGACTTHGVVAPKKSMVVSVNLDTGLLVYRCIFFGDVAASLFASSVDKLFADFESDSSLQVHMDSLRKAVMGRIVRASGRIQTNSYTNTEEIVVRSLDLHPNPVEIGLALAREVAA